jgi:hypothetical protein
MKLATILATLALTGATHAEPLTDASCATYTEMAEMVMRAHQAGVPMAEVMDTDSQLLRDMALVAYASQRMISPINRQRQIDAFRDAVALDCYTAMAAQ